MTTSTDEKFTVGEVVEDGEQYLAAIDLAGNNIAYARNEGSRWAIIADDGLELPEAYVGDEAAARCWLAFLAHLWLT